MEKEEANAEYMIKDGKHFLKINGEYVEVEIASVKGGQQVMPKTNSRLPL